MAKKMLIDATHPEETRVVVADGNKVEDFDFESISKKQIAGNIYLAKVTRVEPSLQAAFVEYGGNRHGFLAFSEIHPDYYQIPKADREALIAEEEAEARKRAQSDDGRRGNRRRGRRRDEEDEVEESAEADEDSSAESDGSEASETIDASESEATEGAPETVEAPEAETVTAAEAPADDAPSEEPNPEAESLADLVAASQEDAPAEAPRTADETASDDDDNGEGDEDGGKPRSIAESAGADDEERVEEDYVPAAEADAPAATKKTDAEAAEAASSETDEAPSNEAVEAKAPTEDQSEGEADGDASGDDADSSDDPDSSDDSDSSDGDDNADGSDEDGDRRRRRSRRGGRSRRSRRTRGKGEEGDPQDDKPREEKSRARSDDSSKDTSDDDDSDDDDSTDAPTEAGGGEDDFGEAISARRIFQRRYKIQEVIKVRQILLVQVVKEERGNKGAALTTYLSLAGRYCVLMPNTARGGGISRKITNAADRKKLKDIAGELEVPKGMGLIIRTAGAKRTGPEIKRDYEYLLRQWEQIREITLKSVAPTLIYEEGSLIKRVIRDLYSSAIDQILVEGEAGWREARDYMGMLMPTHARNVVLHDQGGPLFAKHGVEQELGSMLNPTVQLKSGGYIVIGVTEALVAIDINSGKSTKEGSIEDTALKTNLEAADEIARQLRLRDLAGLIVIDFIDMEDGKNNRAVEKRMKDKLKADRARIQIGRISAFGLMEMSRQRLRPGVLEATTSPCAHCHGTGLVRADSSLALTILRQLEGEASRGRAPELLVRAPMGAAAYLLNDKRDHLMALESRYGVVVKILSDPTIVSPEFHVDRVKTPTRRPIQTAAVTSSSVLPPDLEEEPEEAEIVAETPAEAPEAEAEPAASNETDTASEAKAPEAPREDGEGARRRRGRRGGRRRRRGGADDGDADGDADNAKSSEASAEASGDETDAEAEDSSGEASGATPAALAPAFDPDAGPVDIPAPKRTRRRRKPKQAEAEAEASEGGSTMTPAAEPEGAEAAPETTPEPAPEPEKAAETPTSAEEAVEPAAEDEPEETPSDEPALETAAAEPTSGAADVEKESPRPKKRGWWSIGR